MKHHRLNGTDLSVSTICLGGAPFSPNVSPDTTHRLYTAFREAGGNFFDSAHCYSFWMNKGLGANERALGECLRASGDRAKVVVSTKGGHPASGDKYPRPDAYLAPEVIARDIGDSLERLGVEQIDLYYLHRDDPRVPVDEIIDMLNGEVAKGRIRYPGASNWTTARIEAANTYAAGRGLQGFVASQPKWCLAHPNPSDDPTIRFLDQEDEQWHTRHQFPAVPYSPTACGYFASAGKLARCAFDNATSTARLERVTKLASQRKVSPNQIALAWLLSQPFPVIPILGTTKPDHLADALDAVSVELSAEETRWLRG